MPFDPEAPFAALSDEQFAREFKLALDLSSATVALWDKFIPARLEADLWSDEGLEILDRHEKLITDMKIWLGKLKEDPRA